MQEKKKSENLHSQLMEEFELKLKEELEQYDEES